MFWTLAAKDSGLGAIVYWVSVGEAANLTPTAGETTPNYTGTLSLHTILDCTAKQQDGIYALGPTIHGNGFPTRASTTNTPAVFRAGDNTGTNVTGNDTEIRAGKGTGIGTAGIVKLYAHTTVASGTGAHSATEAARTFAGGHFKVLNALGVGADPGTSGTIKLATAVPAAAGEIGMNTTTGRPQAYIGGTARALAHTGELWGVGTNTNYTFDADPGPWTEEQPASTSCDIVEASNLVRLSVNAGATTTYNGVSGYNSPNVYRNMSDVVNGWRFRVRARLISSTLDGSSFPILQIRAASGNTALAMYVNGSGGTVVAWDAGTAAVLRTSGTLMAFDGQDWLEIAMHDGIASFFYGHGSSGNPPPDEDLRLIYTHKMDAADWFSLTRVSLAFSQAAAAGASRGCDWGPLHMLDMGLSW
ncbi:MAG TPA: hypothetical protein VD948_02780 [Rhodothermales bacterium]|nr:hypothetical protein [Rhodothermales bacterium]